jgi:hypothetical protein
MARFASRSNNSSATLLRMLPVIGGVAVVALLAPTPQVAAAGGPTITLSKTAGAVGDTVNVSGTIGSCRGVVTVRFGLKGDTFALLKLRVPPGPSGSWSIDNFEIPPVVPHSGGLNLITFSVSPGRYTFSAGMDGCPGLTSVGYASAPFQVTGTFVAQPDSRFVGMARTADGKGYWLAQKGGGIFTYGDAHFNGALPSGRGGLGITPAAPISGIAATPDGKGYWLVGEDGGVFSFGDAHFYGSLPGEHITPYEPIVGIVPTPDELGYWLIDADQTVYTFGDAHAYGSHFFATTTLSATALVPSSSGLGYFEQSLEGRVLSRGDAATLGANTGATNAPALFTHWFSGMAGTTDGKGVWRVGTDGGVFTLGDASYFGSVPGEHITPRAPIVGIARTPKGGGYWLVGADGGVFSFGDAGFYGSAGASGLPWST